MSILAEIRADGGEVWLKDDGKIGVKGATTEQKAMIAENRHRVTVWLSMERFDGIDYHDHKLHALITRYFDVIYHFPSDHIAKDKLLALLGSVDESMALDGIEKGSQMLIDRWDEIRALEDQIAGMLEGSALAGAIAELALAAKQEVNTDASAFE